MRRRLKWVRVYGSNIENGVHHLMQTARGVVIARDLPPGSLVYLNSHGNIKPMPRVFGIVVTKDEQRELNARMRKKYGSNWRNQIPKA